MDWMLFWSAVTAGTGLLTISSGVVVFLVRAHTARLEQKIESVSERSESYTDAKIAEAIAYHQREITEAVRQHVDLALEANLNKLAQDITLRINGTYMRTPEARARFDDLQRQIDNLN